MDYAAISRLIRDARALRRKAKELRLELDGQLSTKAEEFLSWLSEYDGSDPLTGRQQEFLSDLIARAAPRRKIVGNYRAYQLLTDIKGMDFGESAEEFIDRMHSFGPEVALTEGQWEFLIVLCKQKGVITHWVPF